MKRFSFLFLILFFLACLAPAVHAEEEGGESPAASTSEGSSEGKHPMYAYIDMQSVTLPIITEKGLTQQLSVAMTLEVPYEQKRDFEAFQPRLIDAYIQDLYGALGSGFGLTKNGVADIAAIKQRVVRVTNDVLAPANLKPHDVLLQVVQQQTR